MATRQAVTGEGRTELGPRQPTRQRLIDAAVALFAERGYEGTSVGEIESTAGLAPRSGALYKHFPSKHALLEAALAQRMGAIERLEDRIELLPLGDLDAELTVIARLALEELDRERELARVVMKDGDRFPEVTAGFHTAIVRRGHLIAETWVERRLENGEIRLEDPAATAQVLTDALVGYALQHFIFGEHLDAVERDRFVAAWVATARALLIEAKRGGPDG
jgi:AcrR family transcriptional regulator